MTEKRLKIVSHFIFKTKDLLSGIKVIPTIGKPAQVKHDMNVR